jgi:hypothetical protein
MAHVQRETMHNPTTRRIEKGIEENPRMKLNDKRDVSLAIDNKKFSSMVSR